MMLGLLIYCYTLGVFSSRQIERATWRGVGVRFMTGDTHPDHDTICTFRRENLDLIAQTFLEVLKLAREMGLLEGGDHQRRSGTHIRANASEAQECGLCASGRVGGQLKLDIAQLLEKSQEEADVLGARGSGGELPQEIARRDKLREKMASARATLQLSRPGSGRPPSGRSMKGRCVSVRSARSGQGSRSRREQSQGAQRQARWTKI